MSLTEKISGIVYNIQRFSLHDGPGIRLTVFLKGCNLACKWCHNPESIYGKPQVQFSESNCMYCGACTACPQSAHMVIQNSPKHRFERERCVGCGYCVSCCATNALTLAGESYTPEQILKMVDKESGFFGNDGGVTFSGGEATLQIDFVEATMELCARAGYHVAIDTAGNVPFSHYERILKYNPLFLYDIKHWNAQMHIEGTGVSNERILENFQMLLERKAKIWVRVPVIPNYNDADEDIEKIGKIIVNAQNQAHHKIERMELLPYHNTGTSKYLSLGKQYEMEGIPSLNKKMLIRKSELLGIMGLTII